MRELRQNWVVISISFCQLGFEVRWCDLEPMVLFSSLAICGSLESQEINPSLRVAWREILQSFV